ncbi:hypothetical protein C8Q73DRAFT_697697 [Cubamyces lactineus]|nr:hypothetical protein C8Q73DRAFT_697697 [Cubamyces lactineus]
MTIAHPNLTILANGEAVFRNPTTNHALLFLPAQLEVFLGLDDDLRRGRFNPSIHPIPQEVHPSQHARALRGSVPYYLEPALRRGRRPHSPPPHAHRSTEPSGLRQGNQGLRGARSSPRPPCRQPDALSRADRWGHTGCHVEHDPYFPSQASAALPLYHPNGRRPRRRPDSSTRRGEPWPTGRGGCHDERIPRPPRGRRRG